MNTRHGHHITGTVRLRTGKPDDCGGIEYCKDCVWDRNAAREAIKAKRANRRAARANQHHAAKRVEAKPHQHIYGKSMVGLMCECGATP